MYIKIQPSHQPPTPAPKSPTSSHLAPGHQILVGIAQQGPGYRLEQLVKGAQVDQRGAVGADQAVVT